MSPADDRPEFEADLQEPTAFSSKEEEVAFLAAVDEGVAAADAGRTIPLEDVEAWVRSLSTDTPLPRPRCG